MTGRRHTAIRGHALRNEGGPFIADLHPGGLGPRYRRTWGGLGVALCECGWASEELHSNNARKQAHRDHKATIS